MDRFQDTYVDVGEELNLKHDTKRGIAKQFDKTVGSANSEILLFR